MSLTKAILNNFTSFTRGSVLEFKRLTFDNWTQFEPLDKECYPDDYISAKLYRRYLASQGFIGLFRDDELIGYCFLQTANRYGHLNRIAVKLSEQGQGYGSVIMTYIFDFFRKRRVSRIGLFVEAKNVPAIALYKKFNFDLVIETWFCYIDEEHIKTIEKKDINHKGSKVRELSMSDLGLITGTFPSIDEQELVTNLSDGSNLGLGLVEQNQLKAFGIFNPQYSGCRSIFCTEIKYFDLYLSKLKQYRMKNYFNISFDMNRQLAELCARRGYKGRRHLWKMERTLEPR